MAGTLKTGDDWTAPTKITENFSAIKIKIDEAKVVCYKRVLT
jgi:hypothetical protein